MWCIDSPTMMSYDIVYLFQYYFKLRTNLVGVPSAILIAFKFCLLCFPPTSHVLLYHPIVSQSTLFYSCFQMFCITRWNPNFICTNSASKYEIGREPRIGRNNSLKYPKTNHNSQRKESFIPFRINHHKDNYFNFKKNSNMDAPVKRSEKLIQHS